MLSARSEAPIEWLRRATELAAEDQNGENSCQDSSPCSAYIPHDQSCPAASAALGPKPRGADARLSSLKRVSSQGGASHSERITMNTFSLKSRTRSVQTLDSQCSKEKQEQHFLLQMHHYECLQLPLEPNALHANSRFYPSSKNSFLPQTHRNERIQLLSSHKHSNKTTS